MMEHISSLEEKGTPIVFVEAAILIEANWMPYFDEVYLFSIKKEKKKNHITPSTRYGL